MTRVLCDKKLPSRAKRKFYKIILRPEEINGFQFRTLNKNEEIFMKISEIRILKRMCVITKLDRIRNEHIK